MALEISTVVEVAGYIKWAIDIYNEIKAVPGEVADLKAQLEDLGKPLSTLLSDLRQSDSRLTASKKSDCESLAATVKAALEDCKQAHGLFLKLKNRHIAFLGGHDIQARTDWLAQAWWRFGVGAEQVKGLVARIEKRRDAIQLALQVAGFKSQAQFQKEIRALVKELVGSKKEREALMKEIADAKESQSKTLKRLEKVAAANKEAERKALDEQAKLHKRLESDAAKKDAQRKALEEKVKKLEGDLAKERAEAKQAKARESLVRTAVDEAQRPSNKPESAPEAAAKRKEQKLPPGPGKLTKTPSIGPKVVRCPQPAPKPPKAGPVVERPSNGEKKVNWEDSKASTNGKNDTAANAQNKENKPKASSLKPPATKIVQVKPVSDEKQEKRRPRPSPSPSPKPPRGEYSVLFVEPGHTFGRAAISHAMLALLDLSLRGKGGRSPIAQLGSACFFVSNKSDCIPQIEGLEYARKSHRLPVGEGGRPVHRVAADLLFQPEADGSGSPPWWQGCDSKGKAELEKRLRAMPSVGMRRSHFKTFDYIVCFTQREHENLLRLRAAIVAKDGKDARPEGKGKILHLGRYLSTDGAGVVEITTVKKPLEREDWTPKIAQIKTALEGFVKQELKFGDLGKKNGA